ncbi:MAG: hypothetical protein ACK548_15245, partial [Planctomycetota bacterium]
MLRIVAVSDPSKAVAPSGGYDAVVLVAHTPAGLGGYVAALKAPLTALAKADARMASAVNLIAADG